MINYWAPELKVLLISLTHVFVKPSCIFRSEMLEDTWADTSWALFFTTLLTYLSLDLFWSSLGILCCLEWFAIVVTRVCIIFLCWWNDLCWMLKIMLFPLNFLTPAVGNLVLSYFVNLSMLVSQRMLLIYV